MVSSFLLKQDVFRQQCPAIPVRVITEDEIDETLLVELSTAAPNDAIGISPAYGPKFSLKVLAIATLEHIIVIRLTKSRSIGRNLLAEYLLCQAFLTKYAFRMDKLSATLFSDLGLHINTAVDLLSVSNDDRNSQQALMNALGGETTLNREGVRNLMRQEEGANTEIRETACQAWAACKAGTLSHMQQILARIPRIDTLLLNKQELVLISKNIRIFYLLLALKPLKVRNEVDGNYTQKQGQLNLTSTRFKTRIMASAPHQKLVIEGDNMTMTGQTKKVKGRGATISLNGSFSGSIKSVTTIGRERATNAESLRSKVMLQAMQRSITLLQHPFVQKIWFSGQPDWSKCPTLPVLISLDHVASTTLNCSQKNAVDSILSSSNDHRVVLIQGPPGTGKTTVIASAVMTLMASSDQTRTLWLVAQSNVAVKNIAEKLAAVRFLDFKLLVSMDFHYDWHEHLYGEDIVKNLIRSDLFTDQLLPMERLLAGSRVILCTLSMLSLPRIRVFSRLVPLQTVIFDEASQIEIGDYFPMLHSFSSTLTKLVFIGDDKQLAPYGQNNVPELKSIFEMSHLKKRAVFLDTQYRMPTIIGAFISKQVYGGRLKTVHSISGMDSCFFVDVKNGHEERNGNSWINRKQVETAVRLAKGLIVKKQDFRIITPYDAQRNLLEVALKDAGLNWKDKCFNVDSFQGNESDYIIISLVRTQKVGFLKEYRRVNVMLTRCKRGMIICTNRKFLETTGSKSLVNGLAKCLGPEAWINQIN